MKPVAVTDFEEIVSYITGDSPVSADHVRLDILDIAESLVHQPGLGFALNSAHPASLGSDFFPLVTILPTSSSIASRRPR